MDELIPIDAIAGGTSIIVAVFEMREYHKAQPSQDKCFDSKDELFTRKKMRQTRVLQMLSRIAEIPGIEVVNWCAFMEMLFLCKVLHDFFFAQGTQTYHRSSLKHQDKIASEKVSRRLSTPNRKPETANKNIKRRK